MSAAVLPLAPGEIHIWRASLDCPAERVAALASTLSHDERDRAERFRAPRDQARYAAARGLLREILARYTGAGACDLRLEYGPQGKPEIACTPGTPPLHFNVSHSGQLAIYALARGARVGLDLERVRQVPHAERIASRVFPPREMRSWLDLPKSRKLDGFFARWTRLEAIAKLHGGGVWWLVRHGGAIPELAEVTVLDLDAPNGFRAAVAVEGEPRTVREMGEP